MISFRAPSFFLHLIRHGETDANIGGTSSFLDEPLNECGREQAQALGRWLARGNAQLPCVYASPLVRARDTATLTLEAMGVSASHIRLDDRLVELNRGMTWAGRSRKENITPDVRQKMVLEGMDFCTPGGESLNHVAARMRLWLIDAVVALPEDPDARVITAFTHGNSLRALFQRLTNMDPSVVHLIRFANTSITSFAFTSRGWRLIQHNAQPHLDRGLWLGN